MNMPNFMSATPRLRATVIFLLPVLLLTLAILALTGFDFTYTLDDPYIHLALAKNIFLGNYGINLTEPSAPASSILWPYLLAIFAFSNLFFTWVPLLINSAFVVISGLLLCRTFDVAQHRYPLLSVLLVTFFMGSLNLYGLVFTGMEHSLQVLLVIIIASSLMKAVESEEVSDISLLGYGAILLLPLVRYEGMAIAVPVLAYAFFRFGRVKPIVTLGLIMLGLVGFSVYLESRGLGYLPSSVLAKSSHDGGISSILSNTKENLSEYGFMAAASVFMAILWLRRDPLFSLMLVSVTALHMVFGRHGWFARYEVYYLMFILLIAVRMLIQRGIDWRPTVVVLPIAFLSLVKGTVLTPLAAANIHNQHGEMAEITRRLDAPVAVNDLGLVALTNPHYTLDLWGLGSYEALKRRTESDGSTGWVIDLMDKNDVHYAMVYDRWISPRPDNWIKVGTLSLTMPLITPAEADVSLYATGAASAEHLRNILEQMKSEGLHSHAEISIVPAGEPAIEP